VVNMCIQYDLNAEGMNSFIFILACEALRNSPKGKLINSLTLNKKCGEGYPEHVHWRDICPATEIHCRTTLFKLREISYKYTKQSIFMMI